MKNKVPYNILNFELEKLYNKEIPESDIDVINNHCEFIQEFIEACGWTCEEVIEKVINGYNDISVN